MSRFIASCLTAVYLTMVGCAPVQREETLPEVPDLDDAVGAVGPGFFEERSHIRQKNFYEQMGRLERDYREIEREGLTDPNQFTSLRARVNVLYVMAREIRLEVAQNIVEEEDNDYACFFYTPLFEHVRDIVRESGENGKLDKDQRNMILGSLFFIVLPAYASCTDSCDEPVRLVREE